MQVNGVTTKVEGFNLPIPVGILPVVIPDSLNIPEKILQNILLKLLVDSTQGTLSLGRSCKVLYFLALRAFFVIVDCATSQLPSIISSHKNG